MNRPDVTPRRSLDLDLSAAMRELALTPESPAAKAMRLRKEFEHTERLPGYPVPCPPRPGPLARLRAWFIRKLVG